MKTIDELREEYLKITKGNTIKTEMYAHLGSLGVSPKHLKLYEESIVAIEEFNRRREARQQ